MRFTAETKRLLTAIRSMHSQNRLGRGKAWDCYWEQAKKSAQIIIGRGC